MEKQQGSAASPQVEDGFIRIASEIVGALCKVNLYPYESRVLWFILRKTYGWQKKTDWISLSQFSKGTGLDRRNVYRALKRLQEGEIVIRNGDSQRPQYGLQKDYTKWRVSSRKTTGVYRDDGLVSTEMTGVVSIKTPTIDTITKDTITKDTPLPPKNGGGGWLKKLFSEKHKERFGEDYHWSNSEQGLVREDATKIPREKWPAAIDRYFLINGDFDRFVAQRGYDYTALHHRWNKVVGGGNRNAHLKPAFLPSPTELARRKGVDISPTRKEAPNIQPKDCPA